jgi:hypothetical protein
MASMAVRTLVEIRLGLSSTRDGRSSENMKFFMSATIGGAVTTRNAPKHYALRFAKLDRMVLEPNT